MVCDCCTIIPKANLSDVENYKYHPSAGTRLDGILDKLLWNPVTSVTPKSISPNALTLMGGLCMLLVNVILFTKLPGLDSTKTPNYYRLLVALFIFLYVVFDSIDGKQARRLGLSSALGQFMDHGVDALVVSTYPLLLLLIFPGKYFGMALALNALSLFGLSLIVWRESDLKVFSYSFAGIGVSEMNFLVIGLLIASFFYNGAFKKAVFLIPNNKYKLLRNLGLANWVPQSLYPCHVVFGGVFVLFAVAFPCIIGSLYKKTKHKRRCLTFLAAGLVHTLLPAYLAVNLPSKDRIVGTLFSAVLGVTFTVHNIVSILGRMDLRLAFKGLVPQYLFILARLYDLFVQIFKLPFPRLWGKSAKLAKCYLPLVILAYLYLVLFFSKVIHEITNHLKIPFLFVQSSGGAPKASARANPKIFSGRKQSQ